VRNLNGYEINGRGLRVDLSDSDGGHGDRESRGDPRDPRGGMADPRAPMADPRAPMVDPRAADPRAAMVDPRGGMADPRAMVAGPGMPTTTPVDVGVNMALERFSQDALIEVIAQMKMVATNNPDQARTVMMQNPQLAYVVSFRS